MNKRNVTIILLSFSGIIAAVSDAYTKDISAWWIRGEYEVSRNDVIRAASSLNKNTNQRPVKKGLPKSATGQRQTPQQCQELIKTHAPCTSTQLGIFTKCGDDKPEFVRCK